MWIALVVVAGAALLWTADRGLLAAERRGWIYYRKTSASKGAAAELMIGLATIWDPSQAHYLEEKDLQEDARDEDAEPSDD